MEQEIRNHLNSIIEDYISNLRHNGTIPESISKHEVEDDLMEFLYAKVMDEDEDDQD